MENAVTVLATVLVVVLVLLPWEALSPGYWRKDKDSDNVETKPSHRPANDDVLVPSKPARNQHAEELRQAA